MEQLAVGKAVRKIESPQGMDLTGYIARLGAAEGTHDPVMARAVVFDDGQSRVAIVSCDLLGVSQDVAGRIAAEAARRTAIPAGSIVVACVHTHSGPASIHLENCGDVDASWQDRLVQTVAGCVEDAAREPAPGYLTLRQADCAIAFNRVFASGPVDRRVSVLEIAGCPGGAPHTMLVNFACHPVSLTETNRLVSRDYIHYLEEELRRIVSPGLDVVFLQGCCGDLDPLLRGGFAEAKRTGEEVAAAIAGGEIVMSPIDFADARVFVETRPVRVPLDCRLDALVLEEELLAHLKAVDEEDQVYGTVPTVRRKVEQAYANWCSSMLRQLREGTVKTTVEADCKRIGIGPLTLATLPFEAFCGVGIKIRERLKGPAMVVCYADGDFGYLPDEALYDRAHYEVQDAYKFYGYPAPVAKEAAQVVMDSLLTQRE